MNDQRSDREKRLANAVIQLVVIIAFLLLAIAGLVWWVLADHSPEPLHYL